MWQSIVRMFVASGNSNGNHNRAHGRDRPGQQVQWV